MRDKILRLELYDKFEEESLIKEVLSSLPVRVENTLTYYRSKILGKVPIDRDAYDPAPILSAIPGGDKLMVLDSNDLPEDWKDEDFTDLLTEANHDEANVSSRTMQLLIMLSISGLNHKLLKNKYRK